MVAFNIVFENATTQHQRTVAENVKDQTDGNVDVLMIDARSMVNGEPGVSSLLVPNHVVLVPSHVIDYVIHHRHHMEEILAQKMLETLRNVIHNHAQLMVDGENGHLLVNAQKHVVVEWPHVQENVTALHH